MNAEIIKMREIYGRKMHWNARLYLDLKKNVLDEEN